MTINPINMQVSIPRASEVSQIQQQALQKTAVDQSQLGQQATKEIEHSRSKTTNVEETDKSIIKDENESGSKQDQDEPKRKKKKVDNSNEDIKSIHPYKGHSIDIKL